MKKILISIVAVAFVALMIANAHAQFVNASVQCTVPPPPCTCWPPGFTPGFWKHDIEVRLSHPPYPPPILTKASYNAFGWGNVNGDLAGVKLTDAIMDYLLGRINDELKAEGNSFQFDFVTALGYLNLNGWDPARTNTANWFNWAAGYGPF